MAKNREEEELKQKEPSIGEQFTESLSFFAPQIIGGLIGSVVDGGRGAIAGIEGATKMADSFRNAKKDQFQLETQRLKSLKSNAMTPKAFQQSEIFDSRTNEKLSFNPNTGTHRNSTGQAVPVEFQFSQKAELQGQRLGVTREGIALREEQGGIKIEQSQAGIIERSFGNFETKVRKDVESVEKTGDIIDLLNSNQPITSKFITPFIARSVQGEVGALTEGDRKGARVPLNIFNRMKSDSEGWLTGDMSVEERKATKRLLKVMNDKKKNRLETKLSGFANDTTRQKNLKLSKDQIETSLRSQIPSLSKRLNTSSKDKLNSFDVAKKKRYEEFKASRGNK